MNVLIYENKKKGDSKITKLIQQYMSQQNEICPDDIHMFHHNLQPINKDIFDIAFLYLEQNDSSALDIAKILIANNPNCLIMFISHCYDYVCKAFEIKAFQYIFEPLDIHFFYTEIERMFLAYKKRNFKFMLHTNKGKIIFRTKDIIFIETYYNHIKIVTNHQTYLTNIKQKNNLLNILKTLSFIKIQRSYIINMNHIMFFTQDGVLLKNKVFLPTSPLRKEEIMLEYSKFQKQ